MNRAYLFAASAVSVFILATAMPTATMACYEGCDEEPPQPEEPQKGNNGWGNGPDSTNAGSFSGKTAVTKDNNGLNQPRLGPVPAVNEKFTGR